MKILHVVQAYHPARGGTEWLIQNLSERLVSQYGDEVTVFTTTAAQTCEVFWIASEPQLPSGEERLNGVRVRRFPIINKFGRLRHLIGQMAYGLKLPYHDWARALFNGPLVPNLTQAIAEHPCEVIAASSFPFLHMQQAVWGGQRRGTGVVLHGALHTTDRWGFDRRMILQTIQQADGYIANSQFERDYLVERGIAADKIHPIGVGVEAAQFAQADGSDLRRQYGWGDAPVIAFVGQLNQRKGVPLLLEMMPRLWETHPDVKLLLAGARTYITAEFERQAERLNGERGNRIVIKTDFAEAEKAAIFATCDLLAFPSEQESFGIALVEAWACRKPVVALRVGPMPSIIDHDIDGLLVPPHDNDALTQAMRTLLANPSLRQRMGEAGYRKVGNRYTWDVVVSKFRQVYGSVLR